MGFMDIAALFNTGPDEPGMFDQIKAAGEGFAKMSGEVSDIKAMLDRVEKQNAEILRMLREQCDE